MPYKKFYLTETAVNVYIIVHLFISVCARTQETSNELRKLREKTKMLKKEQIDFKTIQDILREGILAFSNFKEKWSKLVHFFEMTSNIIQVCLNKSVNKLIEQVSVTVDDIERQPG